MLYGNFGIVDCRMAYRAADIHGFCSFRPRVTGCTFRFAKICLVKSVSFSMDFCRFILCMNPLLEKESLDSGKGFLFSIPKRHSCRSAVVFRAPENGFLHSRFCKNMTEL